MDKKALTFSSRKVPELSKRIQFFSPICRRVIISTIFDKMWQIARGRVLEFDNESGPWVKALKTSHIKHTRSRLNYLQKLHDNANVFFKESQDSEFPDDVSTEFHQITGLIQRFRKQVLDVLVSGSKGEETTAELSVTTAKRACAKIALSVKDYLEKSWHIFEHQLTQNIALSSRGFCGVATVISLDMAQYGKHTQIIDGYFEAEGVEILNSLIQKIVTDAIRKAHLKVSEFTLIDTGDGVLLIIQALPNAVKCADKALCFAQNFYTDLRQLNVTRPLDQQVHFRLGVATGKMVLKSNLLPDGTRVKDKIAGCVIGKAVRLQSAARTGEILICEGTRRKLSRKYKSDFRIHEKVFGKVHEKTPIVAYRCKIIEPIIDET